MAKRPAPTIQTTTLWDFPSQNYGEGTQGDQEYVGATPSYLIWNLLHRYTKPGDKVLDPMCGSGTTLDVCKDLKREGVGFDLAPSRPDIRQADARKLPLDSESIDFVFVDPPYSTHVRYSGRPECIGELDARGEAYYEAMERVIAEMYRVLKPGGYCALYVSDSFAKGKTFAPIGFELFLRLSRLFEPVDIVCVVRHNKTLKRNHWHTAAIEGNYYLRGFNYLFIMRKNPKKDATLLDQEKSGTLSRYFRAVTRSRPGEVITPETLARAMVDEKERLDTHVERKERKAAFKAKAKVERPAQGRKKRDQKRDKASSRKSGKGRSRR